MTQLGEAFVDIRAALDKLDKDLAAARGKVDKSVGKLSGIELGISTAVATKGIELVQDGIRLATDMMVDGVTKAADLESQLDAIGAISGATEEQVAGLNDLVNELGLDPNLKVSAFEAAGAIEELAAGGVALEDIMGGAARGTVALANATGADFSLAATVAADSMSLFNIGAQDLEQVIDGVAAVAVQSKFDVNDYALALAQAGGIAATSGVEFDDFNTTIAAIAPLFASGSDAGTSLKVMLQRLVADTGPAKAAMIEVGLITADTGEALKFMAENGITPVSEDLPDVVDALREYGKETGKTEKETTEFIKSLIGQQNAFFDAEGNLKSMAEIAGLMEDAFAGLSEEQRNSAMQTIFGTDAMRAAVGLMGLGEEGFTSMQQAMSQTSGMDAAAARMTNLKGATEILNGVVESLQISYGQKLLPKLTEMAQKATEFASTHGPALVDSLVDLTLGAIDFGERAGPTLERGLGTFSRLGDSVNKLVDSALKLGENLGLVNENAEKVDAVMVVLNAVVDAAMAPWNGLITIVDLVSQNFEAMERNFSDIKEAIDGMTDSSQSLIDRIGELGASLIDLVVPDWLIGHSPSPLERGIRGVSDALRQMPDFSASLDFGTPSFPALAGATGSAGGGGNTTIVNVDGVSATSFGGGDPADEAIRLTVQMLRMRLKRKR